MALELFLTRHMGALRPADAVSEEALRSITHGETVRATISRPRNLLHHRKYMSLLTVVFPHQSTYSTFDSFRGAVAAALGHCETVKLPDGRIILMPKSISFAKMDQAEFERFYDRAIELIRTKILPGIDRADVEREVEEIMAGYQNSIASIASHQHGKGGVGDGVGDSQADAPSPQNVGRSA